MNTSLLRKDLPDFPKVTPIKRTHRPLGQMLVEAGAVSPRDKLRILGLQSRMDAKLGDLLLAHDLIDPDTLYQTIARQYQTQVADLKSSPPNAELVADFGVDRCVSQALLPWKHSNGCVLIATSAPERFADAQPELERLFGPVRMVIASENAIHQAILQLNTDVLTERAETRVADNESCRSWNSLILPRFFMLLAALLVAGAIFAPGTTFLLLAGWAILTLAANSALKAAATIMQVRSDQKPAESDQTTTPIIARLPTVSIMVALYKEHEIAGRLIERLSRLTYPKELLDICLVIEADDTVTAQTIAKTKLPAHIRTIVVPDSQLKTKPRALNYALDFCRGSIIGVYDAEDAPAPDQIQCVVRRFYERGPEVACLQGVLDFYNAKRNWLSRCFAAEYAAWFRVLLPGFTKMGLVIPLGGTSLFFRRTALEDLGAWDAHNVTEDADLGIRLARHGYRTELIDSVTEEEANCWFFPWIRQRSRWLKGYMITWAVHTRNPAQLWRDLGAWKFFGVQMLLLGTISQFLLAPFLWTFWMPAFGLPHPLANVASLGLIIAIASFFVLSEVLNVVIGIYAVRAPQHRHLMPWVPTMILYFPVAVAAAYKGLAELITRPFYWDKAAHGADHTAPVILTEPAPKDAQTLLRHQV